MKYDPEALTVECPRCHQPPGEACVNASGGTAHPHTGRVAVVYGWPMKKMYFRPEPVRDCEMCGEPCPKPFPDVVTMVGHRECFLRETLGGIGHLIAHEYWCVQKHDPDAGLTYRQSALLADAWVHVMGVPGVETVPDSM